MPRARFRGRFDVAVLQIGGNDIDSNSCPLLLASKLEDFAKFLQSNYRISHIYISEIFTRPQPRCCLLQQYESNHVRALHYLETLLENNIHIRIWRHRRIFSSPFSLFKRDRIHLNQCGMKRFYESLKRAVILVVEEHKRTQVNKPFHYY